MKTPRLTDFDPNANVHTLKSSLDNMPSIQRPQPRVSNNPPKSAASAAPLANPQPAPKTTAHPTPKKQPARPFVRRTFDFYDDQITFLSRKSLQGKLDGKEMSMNEMVRAAIDEWIHKNNA